MPTKKFRASAGGPIPTSTIITAAPCLTCGAPEDWRKQIAGAKDKLADLGGQVEALLAAKPMTADERKDVDRRMTEHRMMFAAEVNIRAWFINNRRVNVDAGLHEGKTLDQIVIAYLEGRM